MVTIQADRAGLQLARFGDVRINGVLVGQVRSVEPGRRAGGHRGRDRAGRRRGDPRERRRADHPDHAVRPEVRLVRPPANPTGSLQDGDVIPADRVETNVELSKILADLFPLLRAVQPAELNYTLNALATALEGRGEQLGETLDQLDAYLGAISDKLPTLQAGPDLAGERRRHLRPGRAGPDRGPRQPHGDQQDDHREGRRPRQLLLRPRGPGGHLDAGAVGQREEPDPGRPGHRAGAQAAGDLLAGVPLPHRGRRQVRTAPGHAPSRATRSSSTSSSAPPSTRPTTPTTARSTARSGTARGATACRTPRSRRTRRRSRRARTSTRTRPPATCPRSSPAGRSAARRPARGTGRPAAMRAPTPRRRSSTRSSPERPAGPPTRTAPWGRCSTARS